MTGTRENRSLAIQILVLLVTVALSYFVNNVSTAQEKLGMQQDVLLGTIHDVQLDIVELKASASRINDISTLVTTHCNLPGHPVMQERVGRIEERVRQVEQ